MSHLLWYPGHERLVHDVVRAANCHVWDSRGARYVDLESGVWAASIGHSHPRVLRALTEQAARIAHTGFSYTGEVAERVAREILALLGFEGGRCVFLCSGSEAVEYGVRVARMVSHRPLLMTLADSYFGAYGSASLQSEHEWFGLDWLGCPRCSGGEAHCAHREATPFGRIGGFLFEPGSSSGFVRFPPETLIHSIAERVRRDDGLLMVNEVTTGVGRTGTWFGYQHYGISPDVVALGKGIGNGYPVSVTAFAPRVIERLGDREVRYAQSHQNDALGAAVAHEVLRVIEEDGLIDRGREIGALLRSGLERVQARTGRIREVRCRGLMIALELEDDAAASFTSQVHRELARRGFLVGKRPGNVLRLDPSLTVAREDVEAFLATLDGLLGELAAIAPST